jgi:hypothetical protein
MGEEQIQVQLVLLLTDDMDSAELDELTRSLRDELLELPVDGVAPLSAGSPPAGAKVVDPTSIGTLLVTMVGTGGLLVAVVETIRAWLISRGGQRVVLELGEAKLELSTATATERQELISRFLTAVETG